MKRGPANRKLKTSRSRKTAKRLAKKHARKHGKK